MRRKNREITDKEEIFAVLKRCDTIRIAFRGEKYPYIVPVSFGMEIVEGDATIYFHCAKEGMKLDLMEKCRDVCVEADRFIKVEPTAHGITTRYESVIGFGSCEKVTRPEEILKGLRLLVEHYGYDDYPLERCKGLENVTVCRIRLASESGKRNLPE